MIFIPVDRRPGYLASDPTWHVDMACQCLRELIYTAGVFYAMRGR